MAERDHRELFDDLRRAAEEVEDREHRERVRAAVAELESSAGHPTFGEKHAVLMEALNEQATVFAQYLPALARLLG